MIKYLVQEHPVGKCERLKMKCHHLQRIFSKYGTFIRNIVSDAAKAGWKTAVVFPTEALTTVQPQFCDCILKAHMIDDR